MTREEAIECIEAIHVQMFNSGNSKWTKACDMAIEALKDRPHGEWIFKHNSADIWCSNCDDSFDEIPQKFLFCPNCGADMRGEAE